MADAPEKTAEELAAEERELAIKRGDIIPEDDENEAVEASAEGADDAEEGDDDGGEELEAADAEAEGDEAEGESEEDSAPEASAEGDAGEEKGEEKPIMIPKARFDEAQRKAREKAEALEAKLKKAEADHIEKQTSADIEAMQNEINELEDKWEAHLMEGEEESAKAIRRELSAKRNEMVQRQLLQQSQQTGNAAVEQIRYETKLAIFEEKYPQINPDSDLFDEDVHNEVAELKAAFEGRGWGSTAALEKAMGYAIREEVTPPAEDSNEERAGVKKSQRAHKARKAAAAASKATPPDASKAGRDSDKGGKGDGLPDVSKMTPEQFAKWADSNPSEMASLRGDTLSSDEAAA